MANTEKKKEENLYGEIIRPKMIQHRVNKNGVLHLFYKTK